VVHFHRNGWYTFIGIHNFPTLTPTRPYVLFKIQQNCNRVLNGPIVSEIAQFENYEHSSQDDDFENTINIDVVNNTEDKCITLPNPFQSNLNIQCNFRMLKIEIFDSNGNLVSAIVKPTLQEDFGFLSSGLYTLKVLGISEVRILKIVKL
jgi:Secretion system C-terminal sorting domain